MKIVIIDYEIGNVRSMINAFEKMGTSTILSNKKEDILNADGVVLPGVGAFASGMEKLKKLGLPEILQEYISTDKPFLGVCLGMQMLFDNSEEFGNNAGLGFIEGSIIKLPINQKANEKLPHISWNEISKRCISWEDTILDNIEEGSDMYFVHSFVASPKNENNALSVTEYLNHKFCSSVKKNNIYGCQFHPEKSGEIGLKIIKNFINICKEN